MKKTFQEIAHRAYLLVWWPAIVLWSVLTGIWLAVAYLFAAIGGMSSQCQRVVELLAGRDDE